MDPEQDRTDDETEEGAAAPAEPRPTDRRRHPVLRELLEWRDLLRDLYFTFDRRTLGFTRILLGFFLIGDLFRRTWDWEAMFSTVGVLPNHVNLWRSHGNLSILNAFSTPGELWVLWAIMLATYFCLLVGFKTKVMQVLSLVWVVSLNGRLMVIENGGYVVHNLLLLWTCFLPLGDRFSIDALSASLKRTRERSADDLNDRTTLDDPDKPNAYISALGLVLLIQIAAIYFFNVVHKTGPAWKNGTAVHYVLYVDRMVTPLVAHVREYVPKWLLLFMTKSTLGFEAAIPACLLCPLARHWARRLAVVMMNALHLGFGTVFVLGPFAWALCVWSTLLFGHEDWAIAIQTMRRVHRARTVLFDPRSPGALFVCRVLKRMDRFGLLAFEASATAPHGLAVRTPGGEEKAGPLALADMVAALPLGPCVAWVLRVPGPRHAVAALMAALHRRGAGRAVGLGIPAAAGVAPPPSELRRVGRRALAVLREAGVLIMFTAAINQAMVELWVINRRIRITQREPLWSLIHKARFLQGWFMFSPNPVMEDGTTVVDAITVDGRHIDPFTGKEPNFDLGNVKSYRYNQIWCDYLDRIHRPMYTAIRESMKDYLLRYPERTGRPEDTIVSGDVFWIRDWNPKWGQTQSYGFEIEKGKPYFSFTNPKVQPPSGAPTPEVPALPKLNELPAPKPEYAPPPSEGNDPGPPN